MSTRLNTQRVLTIHSSVKKEIEEITGKQARHAIREFAEANDDKGDILRRYQHISALFRQLQVIYEL